MEIDRPRPAPPRVQSNVRPVASKFGAERQSSYFREFNRPVDIGNAQKPKPQPGKSGAAQYGIERLAVGQRVRHAMFGAGSILSSRDMGGDILYEVRFDTGETKKLMATFARLEKI